MSENPGTTSDPPGVTDLLNAKIEQLEWEVDNSAEILREQCEAINTMARAIAELVSSLAAATRAADFSLKNPLYEALKQKQVLIEDLERRVRAGEAEIAMRGAGFPPTP